MFLCEFIEIIDILEYNLLVKKKIKYQKNNRNVLVVSYIC
jgi:hypothetical protein